MNDECLAKTCNEIYSLQIVYKLGITARPTCHLDTIWQTGCFMSRRAVHIERSHDGCPALPQRYSNCQALIR
jgi:hypothetical protein